tara:strand:+ start:51017 stop:52246 length:1230 start_codon:yes stop_codon:yes gene_type:complete
MWNKILIIIKEPYRKIINSIAFYPAIFALFFLVLSYFSIAFDFSQQGQEFKKELDWLGLRDASTARSIASSIVAGLISLTVFSFSMVMIVLNQTASQMSNRILDSLIGSRFQQSVLGIYIGTIVYALFLLTMVVDSDTEARVPILSTYFLMLITVFDLFLFIYFLHYITQSVKYKVIIERAYQKTLTSMKKYCLIANHTERPPQPQDSFIIRAPRSGMFLGFNEKALIEIGDELDCTFYFLHKQGTFMMEGIPLISVNKKLSDEQVKNVSSSIYMPLSESIEENYLYGFKQLSEVAIKALSPGINDPGTAVLSLRAIFQLLSFRLSHCPNQIFVNANNQLRIVSDEKTFEEIFSETVLPIWDYGNMDRTIQDELFSLLTQFQTMYSPIMMKHLFQDIKTKMNERVLEPK